MKSLKSLKPSNTRNSRSIAAAAITLFAALGLSAVEPPTLRIDEGKTPDVCLKSLDAQVEVTGNVASTRYTMVVKNMTNIVTEGRLTFSLPAGRGVTYYALDIGGKMREAVPVGKTRGTKVFNAIVSRMVDPGLFEMVDDNTFHMRIYPVPANGVRTVAIGYEEELSLENGASRYRLSIDCPDTLESFAVKATVWNGAHKPIVPNSVDGFRFNKAGKNYAASFTRKNYRPAGELSFALPAPADSPIVVMQPAEGSYYFLASMAAPESETREKRWDDDLAIIWDVSLSGSQRDIERELDALGVIFAKKKNANVYLYYLNNTLTKMRHKNTANGEHKVINGNWDELRSILKNAVFDGGTNFSKINLKALAGKEILFFSDGHSTLSDADFIMDAEVNAMRTIHCVVSSAKADTNAMKLIADKTKGKFVNLNTLSSEKLKVELLNESLQFLGTEHVDAVREIYPSVATPVHGKISIAGISDTTDAELTLLFGFGNKVEKRIKVRLDAKTADSQVKARRLWAQKKIAELDLVYEKNDAEIAELGRQFGIVTRNMSFIVLEAAEDYIRYNITPPIGGAKNNAQEPMAFEAAEVMGYLDGPTPVYIVDNDDPNADPLTIDRSFKENIMDIGLDVLGPDGPVGCRGNKSHLSKLTGNTAEDYQQYLKIREANASSSEFYFDFAEWFHKHGDKKRALRVLTSIAELEPKNVAHNRKLGYRLKEYGEYALEAFVCRRALKWYPTDPQNHRDYALALADNGDAQAALDSLYSFIVNKRDFDYYNSMMEEVFVMEMNRLIAKNANLNTSRIDKTLIRDPGADIRVVINWNTYHTQVNIRVVDPNGKIVDMKNGGRPVQILLKNARKGKYRVYVDHYGDNHNSFEPTTVMAEIYTKYADKAEQRRVVCWQFPNIMKKYCQLMEMATFEF